MGIRIGTRIGPVSVSKRVGGGGGQGSFGAFLTLLALLWGLVAAFFALAWPYWLGGWAVEVPYLIVVALGGSYLLFRWNKRLLRQQGRLNTNGKRIR